MQYSGAAKNLPNLDDLDSSQPKDWNISSSGLTVDEQAKFESYLLTLSFDTVEIFYLSDLVGFLFEFGRSTVHVTYQNLSHHTCNYVQPSFTTEEQIA